MAEVQTYQCDVCGKLKEQVNHWWLIYLTEGGFVHLAPWQGKDSMYKMLTQNPETLIVRDYHVCGVEHLHRKLSEITRT